MVSSEDSAWDVPPSMFGARAGGPTVQRMVLGSHLRKLREQRGITAEQAADSIRGSHSKISRMEHGRVGFKERDVADLLTLYGVIDGDERAALLNMARESNTPGWWHAFSDILPTWVEPYVGLEAAASVIRTYQIQYVPGLLQTGGYASALLRTGYPAVTEEELARRTDLRISRQDILSRPGAPQLWAVVDEGVLRRPIGSADVMREQIRHLIEITDHPAVTLQVLPFRVGGHSACGGPFTILRFAEPDLQDVIYIEQLTSALYLDKQVEVDRYLEVMEQLCLQAEPAANTAKLLRKLLDEI
ncbi:MAG TPA: helix-turn-helix transcriptional regulator [Streptosporangiaceae bacterium]|nr:helix-turn-helix transcriptional regulator [Streptosporangiaceae bacterium]